MSGETYADRILREVSAMANGGLEADAVEKAITDACGALQKQMAALSVSCPSCGVKHTLVLPVPNATEIARATAHTTKALDELYRLLQFAKGHPDSRPDFGEWLRLLTTEQFQTLQGWIDAAGARTEREGGRA